VYDMLLIVLGAAPGVIAGPERSLANGPLVEYLTEYFEAEFRADSGEERVDRDWLIGWYEDHPRIDLIPLAEYRSRDLPRAPSRT
jgi:hypothetical protein